MLILIRKEFYFPILLNKNYTFPEEKFWIKYVDSAFNESQKRVKLWTKFLHLKNYRLIDQISSYKILKFYFITIT